MASMKAAKCILRSAPLRGAAASFAAEAKPSRSSIHLPKQRLAVASRSARSPVEMSCAVESLLPMHSATASALMTSMLSLSRRGYSWVSEGISMPL